MKKFVNKFRNWFLIVIILIAGVLASRTLFDHNYYFNMHDDLQMMRQLELEKCFKDMQIPCRWVPDMGYGFGFPLFNYYPQLPYLFGEVFRLASFPFNDVAKLTFALGIIASGFSMYLLAKEFFGKLGGLMSSIFYVWAPYRAVDVYVRGAMNESWAFIWFPLILWSAYKLIKGRKIGHLIILSLSTAALLLTHNLMVMIFVPVALVWVILWLFYEKTFKPIINLLISGVISLSLTAFFTIPAIFEQKFVHIESLTSDYYQYFAHYATFYQLFLSRFWGDGPSAFGPNDGLAFPVGHIHWILVFVILGLLIVKVIKSRKFAKQDIVISFGIIVGTGGAFMSHEKSTFIWTLIPILKYVQFPWRFLTLNVFGYSLAIGALFYLLNALNIFKTKIWQISTLLILTIIVMIFNWNYFKPVHGGPLTDDKKFTGEAWRIQQQAGIRDYLPTAAKVDPNTQRNTLADVFQGEGIVSSEQYGTNWAKFDVETQDSTITVRVNLFNYPVWKVYIDGKETNIYTDNKEQWGRIYINIPGGKHHVDLKLGNTALRTYANAVSLITWIGLAVFILRKRSQKNH